MSEARDVGVIIVAAGEGRRAGGTELKQFRWIAGKPMLLHSLQTFQARADVAMVVCVLPHHIVGDPPPWLFQCDVERLLLSVGGQSRSESAANGLDDLTEDAQIVLVHDAARPLVPATMIDRVVTTARTGVGAIPALPAVDTLKEVADDGRVLRTVDRSTLWRVQTPQGFPRAMLEAAYDSVRRDGASATDDAALCERLGYPVSIVRGSERAAKVTTDADFAFVEALAQLAD